MNQSLCATAHKVKGVIVIHIATHTMFHFFPWPWLYMSCFPNSVFAFWSFIHEYARHSSGEYFFMHFHCLCHSTLVCALDLRFALPSLIKVFPDNPCLCLRLDQFPHSSLCWPLSAETIFFFSESTSHTCPLCWWPPHPITVATQLFHQQRNTQEQCPAQSLAHFSPQALCSQPSSSLSLWSLNATQYVLCPTMPTL